MKQQELDRLGDEICELAAHIAAATYRWLVKVAEFDANRGWAAWGCRSCAHWLNWRAGLDMRSAREKVRVANALADVPLISAALERGEISYSKVRALTRIATPETEEVLLTYAKHGTTAHIEKIVRAYRSRVPVDGVEPDYEQRSLDYRYEEDGSMVIRARLTPEEGLIVLKAIEKVQDEVRKTKSGSAEPPSDRADALVEICERELAGSERAHARGDRYQVIVHVDESAIKGSDGACYIEEGPPLQQEAVRRLTCDGAMVRIVEDEAGNVLDVGRKTRTIPSAMRRALRTRDGGCRFTGCTSTRFVDGHHIKHWSRGGDTALYNLVSLCPFHHRLLHEGKFSLRKEPDEGFTFFRPDGREIRTEAFDVEQYMIEEHSRVLGSLNIEPKTIVPRWDGKACDYSVAIEGLLRRDGYPEYPGGSAEAPQKYCASVTSANP